MIAAKNRSRSSWGIVSRCRPLLPALLLLAGCAALDDEELSPDELDDVGVSQDEIINGGQSSDTRGVPHLVSPTTTCASVLITNRWMLTAAHCITAEDVANPSRITAFTENGAFSETGSPNLIVLHPTLDLALLRFGGGFSYIGGDQWWFHRIWEGTNAELLGQELSCWGYSGDLDGANAGVLRSGLLEVTSTSPTEIVVARNGRGQITFLGDSGGPCQTTDGRLAGIASTLQLRCWPDSPGRGPDGLCLPRPNGQPGTIVDSAGYVGVQAWRTWMFNVMGAPDNDSRLNASSIRLPSALGDSTVMTYDNRRATTDGPVVCGASQKNVWGRFTLFEPEVVYFDTAESSFDTVLTVTDENGNAVAGGCNDDAGCTTGTLGRLDSRLAVTLSAGTYYLSIGGFGGAAGQGRLIVQHAPLSTASSVLRGPLAGSGTVSGVIAGQSVTSSLRGDGALSGEAAHWFLSCGGATGQLFSICPADGGTFTRVTSRNTFADPVMYIRSAQVGFPIRIVELAFNDDSAGCIGTSAGQMPPDVSAFGSRIQIVDNAIARGINIVYIDAFGTVDNASMSYTLSYIAR